LPRHLSGPRSSSSDMLRLRIIILLLALFAATEAVCSEKGNVLRENRFLDSELKLARKPKIYAVFDLRNKKVSIKVRGIELTEFPIENVTLWGNALAANPLSLVAKGSFIKPKRKKIEPGQDKEQDTFELDSLEVNDMPSRYTLYLDRGVSVRVRPAPEGIFLHLLDAGYSLTSTLARSFYSTWSLLKKRPFTEVDITLKKKDAQSLYWDMSEGTYCILAPP
jgi:hypothetical protein